MYSKKNIKRAKEILQNIDTSKLRYDNYTTYDQIYIYPFPNALGRIAIRRYRGLDCFLFNFCWEKYELVIDSETVEVSKGKGELGFIFESRLRAALHAEQANRNVKFGELYESYVRTKAEEGDGDIDTNTLLNALKSMVISVEEMGKKYPRIFTRYSIMVTEPREISDSDKNSKNAVITE